MLKKINLSVGIAAYNAEKNIKQLLEAILRQKELDFKLVKIIVHSDASKDKTVQVAQKFKNKKITIINNKQRKGFSGSLKKILKLTSQEIVVLFNDDIQIKDEYLVNKLIQPFIKENKVGLVCGRPTPLDSSNFIENAITSSRNAYDRMRLKINNGNSKYSCDGKILVLSKLFIQKLKFPKKNKALGNVDTYIYFSCITKGFKFRFVKNAIVKYKNPSNFSDYVKWFTRNNSYQLILKKRFGEIVDMEYYKPSLLFWWCMILEFFKNPLGCLFIFLTSIYIKYTSKKYADNFNPTWDVVTSTKNL